MAGSPPRLCRSKSTVAVAVSARADVTHALVSMRPGSRLATFKATSTVVPSSSMVTSAASTTPCATAEPLVTGKTKSVARRRGQYPEVRGLRCPPHNRSGSVVRWASERICTASTWGETGLGDVVSGQGDQSQQALIGGARIESGKLDATDKTIDKLTEVTDLGVVAEFAEHDDVVAGGRLIDDRPDLDRNPTLVEPGVVTPLLKPGNRGGKEVDGVHVIATLRESKGQFPDGTARLERPGVPLLGQNGHDGVVAALFVGRRREVPRVGELRS